MANCDAEALLFSEEQKDSEAAHDAFEKADTALNWAGLAAWGDIAAMWTSYLAGGGRGMLGFTGGAAKGIADEGTFDDAAEAYNDAWDTLQDATNNLSNAADILCHCLGESEDGGEDGEGGGGIPGKDYPLLDENRNEVDWAGNPWSPW